jgi:hypothetical protein
MLALVSTGLIYGFGFKHMDKVIFYSFSFLFFYFLLNYLFRNKKIPQFDLQKRRIISKITAELILFGSIIVFTIFHLAFLGNVPFISAINTLDYYKIAWIRQDIGAHDSTLIKYISAFMIKGIIPFALLYFSISNRKLFLFLLPVGIFYALSLMQKGLIVSIILPTGVYAFLNKQYLKSFFTAVIAIGGVFVLIFATNPSLRATEAEIEEAMKNSGKNYVRAEKELTATESLFSATDAVYTRVFLTTGLVMGHWFENIPKVYPFAYGCGYHFLAPALGCDYEDYNYARIIYDATYVKEAKMGFKGTITVASFVYDYANFGFVGLFYSGLILALYFILLNKLFVNNVKWNLSLNLLFIFWLTSSAFTTSLFSGGWVITLLLYYLYRPFIEVTSNK